MNVTECSEEQEKIPMPLMALIPFGTKKEDTDVPPARFLVNRYYLYDHEYCLIP
jgi:hypothetical protein